MSEGRGRRRTAEIVQIGLLAGLSIFLIAKAVSWLANIELVGTLISSADHSIYAAAAQRIWAGGPIYPAWELSGPFQADARPELYPPTTIFWLVLPLSLLPALG